MGSTRLAGPVRRRGRVGRIAAIDPADNAAGNVADNVADNAAGNVAVNVSGVHRARSLTAALATALLALTGCGSPSADDITRALEADGADLSVARCVAEQAIASDLSTDSLDRLAEEGITDDDGTDVQYLEDDSAILQALVTACLD